jgi:hypothetical protein
MGFGIDFGGIGNLTEGLDLASIGSGAAAGSSMGPWGAVAGAGIGAASSLIGGNKQNSANQAMAQAQMDFQERMRRTQYQTAVADLKAAGLNPMLAYSQGGAGTPQGATAQMGNPLGDAGNSAREGAIAFQNYQNAIAQGNAINAQANKDNSQATVNQVEAVKKAEETTSERHRQPGYSKYGDQVDKIIDNLIAQAENYRTNTGKTKVETSLAELGDKPSDPSLYRDIRKGIVHTYKRIKQYPQFFTPSLNSFNPFKGKK